MYQLVSETRAACTCDRVIQHSKAKQIVSMLQINFYGERASSHMIDDN